MTNIKIEKWAKLMEKAKGIKENLWSVKLQAILNFAWRKGGLHWPKTLVIERNLKRLHQLEKAMQKSVMSGKQEAE